MMLLASLCVRRSITSIILTGLILIAALTLLTSSSPAATKKHRNSYAQLPAECRQAWKVADTAGPTGYCVPPKFRDLIKALAPYGSQHAREFYDEQERNFGGATVE